MKHPDRALDLQFVLDAFRDRMAGITASAIAIHDEVFSRLPLVEKRTDEAHPFVFIQEDRAGDVLALKLRARTRIDPHDFVAPRLRFHERHLVFTQRRGLLPPELDRARDDRGSEREGEQQGELAQGAGDHLMRAWMV